MSGVISIEEDKPMVSRSSSLKIKAVTPTQRTVEQAKSELLRQGVLSNLKRKIRTRPPVDEPKQTDVR